MGLQMLKTLLLLGTACSTFIVYTNFAHAQTADAATPSSATIAIQGISKTTQQSAITKKIPLKSQYAASHISREEIEQTSPLATAQTILNTEPSIVATSAGPLGLEQNITFRAFNSAQFSQTYSGVALNDVFHGGVTNDLSEANNVLVTKNDFDSVDLYRGINNPAVNSYNSLAGTISYNPREPSDTPGGEAGASVGSFHTFDYHVTVNTGEYDGFKQLFSFERGTSNGWLDNNKVRNNNLYYAFDANTGSTGKIYGNFIFNQNSSELPFDEPQGFFSEFGRNFQEPLSIYSEPSQDTNFLTILGTTQALTDNISFDLKGFFGTDTFLRTAFSNAADQATGLFIPAKDVDPVKGVANPFTDLLDDGSVVGLTPTFKFDLPFNTVTLGANYTLGHLHNSDVFGQTSEAASILVPGIPGSGKGENPNGNIDFNEHDVRTLYSVYVQDEIDLLNDKIKITPGVKYLYANTKNCDDASFEVSIPGGACDSDTSHYTSPTLGASYEFLPNTVVYAAYGQNIEFPTIDAFFDNLGGGKDFDGQEPVHLEPEHVTDYEAGLRYSNAHYGFNGALGFYLENLTNTFITETDPSTGLTNTTNGGSSRRQGIELQLAEDFGEKHINHYDIGDFTGYLNYAYNNAIFTNGTPIKVSSVGSNNAATGASVIKGEPVALVPADIISLGGNWNYDGWEAGAQAQYVTSEFINQVTTGTTSTLKEPAYLVVNLNMSKTIQINRGFIKAVRFGFNVDNLFNRQYDSFAFADTLSKAVAGVGASGASYASIQPGEPQSFFGSLTFLF
jgi:iron complex outermembrane receptor protein